MESRRMYVSYVLEDSEQVSRLLVTLEMVGLNVLKQQADAIAGSDTFVACFGSGSDGAARWNRDEVQRAIDQGRPITLARLTQCPPPAIPGIPASAPILDLHEQWAQSIAMLIAPTAPTAPTTTATSTFKSAQTAVGSDVEITNVHGTGGTPAGGNARSEIAIDKFAVDGKFTFTNVRN
jgi:hypothetical protein